MALKQVFVLQRALFQLVRNNSKSYWSVTGVEIFVLFGHFWEGTTTDYSLSLTSLIVSLLPLLI